MIDRLRRSELLRFIVVGGVNTGVTFLLFLALGWLMPAPLAYTISYLFGIGLSYALNSLFVFQTDLSVRTAVRFPLVYVVQYLYGLVVVSVLTAWLHVPNAAAAAVTIVSSIPLTFVLSRKVLRAA
jgi:putative flippase GtrA